MFELPELIILRDQMREHVKGKMIRTGSLGNSPHKFVWYNRSNEEFTYLVQGKTIGEPYVKGRWLFVPFLPDYVMTLGEFGGNLLFHQNGEKHPAKYHLLLHFTDSTSLSLMIQMWGAIELYQNGEEQERKYIKEMPIDPLNPGFTLPYFHSLLETLLPQGKRSVKSLLTQHQVVPGIGNSTLQDILFHAKLHPKHSIQKLSRAQVDVLFTSLQNVLRDTIAQGGRSDETDLLGNPGRYKRILNSTSVGKPCPICGTTIEKSNYLGGACYFCPVCQE